MAVRLARARAWVGREGRLTPCLYPRRLYPRRGRRGTELMGGGAIGKIMEKQMEDA